MLISENDKSWYETITRRQFILSTATKRPLRSRHSCQPCRRTCLHQATQKCSRDTTTQDRPLANGGWKGARRMQGMRMGLWRNEDDCLIPFDDRDDHCGFFYDFPSLLMRASCPFFELFFGFVCAVATSTDRCCICRSTA